MFKIMVRNDLHGTETQVLVKSLNNGIAVLSYAQGKRLREKLCGSSKCTCGVVRGPQDYGTALVENVVLADRWGRY